MDIIEDLKRFADFDENKIPRPTLVDIAETILSATSNSFIGQYKVKQTLFDRLIKFECLCPYCNNALYHTRIVGTIEGQDKSIPLKPEDMNGDCLFLSNAPQREPMQRPTGAFSSGNYVNRKKYLVDGSLRYEVVVNSINLDHLTPRARGGSDVFHNLLVACETCNKSKSHLTAEEFGYPEIQRLSLDEPQIPIFARRGVRDFATIYLPIEVYESFHAIHGDVSQFIHKEIDKHNSTKGE